MNSSINAVAKRYRFTGKERDEESGLNYHGARYYVPWLCRWCGIDPKKNERPVRSPFDYCSNNPINLHDPDGMREEKKNDGGWYIGTDKKPHFLPGVQFPSQFEETGIKGKFFGVVQGEFNADGSRPKPHRKTFGGNAQSQGSSNTKGKPAEHSVAPATVSEPTPQTASSAEPTHGIGLTLDKVADITVSMTPFIGSGRDLYRGIKDRDPLQIAFGAGGLLLDVFTFGGASVIKGGVKAGIGLFLKTEAKTVIGQEIKHETFTRAMSFAEHTALETNRGLSSKAGHELFVSTSEEYSRKFLGRPGYDVLIQFTAQPGTLARMSEISIMHSQAVRQFGYGHLPELVKGNWMDFGKNFFKVEKAVSGKPVLNIGLGYNPSIFNENIIQFTRIY